MESKDKMKFDSNKELTKYMTLMGIAFFLMFISVILFVIYLAIN